MSDISVTLGTVSSEFCSELEGAHSSKDIFALKIKYLGKSGIVNGYYKSISSIHDSERKQYGQTINEFKNFVESHIKNKLSSIENDSINEKIYQEKIDVTIPCRLRNEGRIHPVSYVLSSIIKIFNGMGFKTVFGPEIEDEYHVFDALNSPAHHPARQMQDTFYLRAKDNSKNFLLRTHTSSVQIRAIKKYGVPLGIISTGKVYRSDWDSTHTPMFHQVEGLYIGSDANMQTLKWCLNTFLNRYFNTTVKTRFRPSYFPFTEPSAEVDIGYTKKNNAILIGGSNDWMEILGCGMVHPSVLDNLGIDINQYRGFAFGIGIERLAMLKYGISDLRMFFQSDLRWLKQRGFLNLKN